MNKILRDWLEDAQVKIEESETRLANGEINITEYNEEMADHALYYIGAVNWNNKFWSE